MSKRSILIVEDEDLAEIVVSNRISVATENCRLPHTSCISAT
jgi:hypothetical protein